METQDQMNESKKQHRSGHIWGGLILLLIGVVILFKQLSFPFVPDWVFSWPMILIVMGVLVGIKHAFRGPFWLLLIVLGGIFMADNIDPTLDFHRFIAPAVIICIGIAIMFRPKRSWTKDEWNNWKSSWGPGSNPTERSAIPQQPLPSGGTSSQDTSPDDYLDSVSVFGGVHKLILSKNFKGGEATSVFGGTELDLRQADINGTVVLELVQVMGGAKLIVPTNWYIKNEINAVFGGVDDKRQLQSSVFDHNKVLVLRGTSFFGGLEIRNF